MRVKGMSRWVISLMTYRILHRLEGLSSVADFLCSAFCFVLLLHHLLSPHPRSHTTLVIPSPLTWLVMTTSTCDVIATTRSPGDGTCSATELPSRQIHHLRKNYRGPNG